MDGIESTILRVDLEDHPAGRVVRVRGEIDLSTIALFRERLAECIDGTQPVIIDCSGLEYLDMSAVRAFEDFHRSVSLQDRQVVIVGSVPIVHKVLEIVKLNQRIPLVDTLGEALRLIEKKE
jgi:anti-sigma B factor antagonist